MAGWGGRRLRKIRFPVLAHEYIIKNIYKICFTCCQYFSHILCNFFYVFVHLYHYNSSGGGGGGAAAEAAPEEKEEEEEEVEMGGGGDLFGGDGGGGGGGDY
jgi:hypothetical protein